MQLAVVLIILDAKHLVAQEFVLQIQTEYHESSGQRESIEKLVSRIESITNGRVKINLKFATENTKGNDILASVMNGTLDCEISSVTNYVHIDPGFQLAGDLVGGYETIDQYHSWFFDLGGREVVQEYLYSKQNLRIVGYWLVGWQSLASTKPIFAIADFNDWKFWSDSKLVSEIFTSFGAKSIESSESEILDDLKNGRIDGADISTISINDSLGLYDVAEFATYPGFYSLPAVQFTCNKNVWQKLPKSIQASIELATKVVAFDLILLAVKNDLIVTNYKRKAGITVHNWSNEDRAAFRLRSKEHWKIWGRKSVAAQVILETHLNSLQDLGLIEDDELTQENESDIGVNNKPNLTRTISNNPINSYLHTIKTFLSNLF